MSRPIASRRFLLFCCIMVLTAPFHRGEAAPGASAGLPALRYTIQDLGTLGGPTSTAHAINEWGQVVGAADIPGGDRHAYLWQDGAMIDLGTLDPIRQTDARGINNLGQVVGTASNSGGIARSFIWENGEMRELGDPSVHKSAYDINDAGQVIGIALIGSVDGHAFLYDLKTDVLTDLGTLGGSRSIAWEINEQGQVVGASGTGEPPNIPPGGAFLWENGKMINLGTLGGQGSDGFGINDNTVVVGWSQTPTSGKFYHAFLWEDGTMTELEAPGGSVSSRGMAINNLGQVVGLQSFLFDPQRGMLKLGDLLPPGHGWSLLVPEDLNGHGWITGWGYGPNGTRAFVMIPVPPIPAASDYGIVVLSLLLLATGAVVVWRRRAESLPPQ